MAKKCYICGKDIDRKNSVKIKGEWYCLQCAAELKELEEKSTNKRSYSTAPEVLALSVENPGMPIIRFFQLVTTTGIVNLGACEDYKTKPEGTVNGMIASAMEGVYYKLLEDLKDKSYQLGANTILGVRVSVTSFSTIEEEFGLIVTLTGTPALIARKKEKSTEKKHEVSHENEASPQNNEFEFSSDFFGEKFEQLDKGDS